MKFFLRPISNDNTVESGFVLVLSLVILLMLSLFGAWALQTSNFELNVAGGLQQVEMQFNVTEGGANTEAANLGFNRRTFYQISDPTLYGIILAPDSLAAFDPGSDNTDAASDKDESNVDLRKSDPRYWPWRNLWPVEDNDDKWLTAEALEKKQPAHNDLDYRYLVTYLHPSNPPMGYDATSFSGYKFRIQGNTARTMTIVELGGNKVGVKMAL
ncbi:MAG: hypothetical protein PHI97_11900 [Desulfobulbus sp.]|nr:hypothetical protein [Desulfobulbus sp.]